MSDDISPYDIYNFALRLIYELHPAAIVKGADDKTFNTMRAIVSGDACLVSSPQEMVKPAAEHRKKELTEYLQQRIGRVIEKDRRIAKMILESMQPVTNPQT